MTITGTVPPGSHTIYGLIQTGLAAARPAPGILDRFYFSTDTLVLERDTGVVWVEVARGETATRLAQLAERAHLSLTGVTIDQHHARDHHTRHEPGGADVVVGVAPGAHAVSHEDGGADEVNVGGLSGLLADDQHVLDAEVLLVAAPLIHAARHENGGADEVNVGGLSGLLADDQHVLDAEVLAVAAPLVHAARHEDGGADEINVGGLSGLLADDQHVLDAEVLLVAAPLIHKDRHDPEDGADPLDTAAPGTIQPDDAAAVGTSHSLSRSDHKHSIVAAAPGAISENASAEGVATSFARSDHNHQHTAALHENGGGAEINVGGLSGLLADDQHVLDAEVLAVAAPLVHAARHENGGADEVNVGGLSGLLADDQHVLDAEVLAVAAALVHAARHKDGGADELDVSELAGALGAAGEIPETDGAAVTWVDPDGRYDPKAHAASHENGGADEIGVGGLSGLLADDQHVLDAEVLAVAAALVHAARHQNGGADEISVAGLSGVLADVQPHEYNTMFANVQVTGGGIITWNGTHLKWTTRLIAIPVEKTEFGASGYIDISCPTAGTVVYYPSGGGTSTVACTADGIPIGAWEALYYRFPRGAASASDQTRFCVVNYQNADWSPDDGWILLATRNGDADSDSVKVAVGVTIPAVGGTYDVDACLPSWIAARTHASQHQNGGADEINVGGLSGLLADDQHVLDAEVVAAAKTVKLDDFATPDDNVNLNASTTRHGLLRKLDNVVTHFLNGQGGFSTPPAAGAALTVAETEVYSGAGVGAWADLDLSGTIGSKASLVLLKILGSAGYTAAFRKNGDTDEYYNIAPTHGYGMAMATPINTIWFVVMVATDSNGVIEWRTETITFSYTIKVIAYIN